MRFFLIIAVLFLISPAFAQDEVTVDLASDHVDITTGFTGTTLELFGVRKSGGDIAVILKGPVRSMSVRRKEKVLGAWMNRSFETFKGVPSYYNVAASVPLNDLAAPEVLKQNGIGTENLQFNKPDSKDEDRITFREAMIRNKQGEGLFAKEPAKINFIARDFFRADFYIPSNTPVGDYEIQTFYFNDGQIKDVKTRSVRVAQTGAAAQIHDVAIKHSFLYGIFCVVLAIFAGWLSHRIRRG
jgi:uncharacterized protein (TIGR02186 family)